MFVQDAALTGHSALSEETATGVQMSSRLCPHVIQGLKLCWDQWQLGDRAQRDKNGMLQADATRRAS